MRREEGAHRRREEAAMVAGPDAATRARRRAARTPAGREGRRPPPRRMRAAVPRIHRRGPPWTMAPKPHTWRTTPSAGPVADGRAEDSRAAALLQRRRDTAFPKPSQTLGRRERRKTKAEKEAGREWAVSRGDRGSAPRRGLRGSEAVRHQRGPHAEHRARPRREGRARNPWPASRVICPARVATGAAGCSRRSLSTVHSD